MNTPSNRLKVYSASAGSGKTFSLTVEYVGKLLKNPYAYKSILAVTFTNKATAEMKNRILSTLWALVYAPSAVQNEIDKIKGEKGASLSDKERENARLALTCILHDYDHFRIETIDSFFQRILRNMAREIGVGSSFEILLDDKDYVEKVVGLMKEAVESNEELKRDLNRLISQRVEQGQKWNYEKEMTDFASNLNKRIVGQGIEASSADDIADETGVRLKEIKDFENKVKNLLNRFFETCEENNLSITDFKGKTRGSVYSRLIKLKGKSGYSIKTDSTNSFKNSDKVEEELAQKNKDLYNIYHELNGYFEEHFPKIKALHIVYASAYKLSLLKYIASAKQELLKEDNRFLLSQTQGLLRSMVESEDVVPFVYERIGSRIHHIMIDEFQDTSSVAWDNFRFLLEECLSSGGDCAVFGDVKQSIYRWNEGDWQILNELYQKTNGNCYNIPSIQRPLSENYRTDERIVNFNNGLFEKAFGELGLDLTVSQTPKRGLGKGTLRFQFLEKKDPDDPTDPKQMVTWSVIDEVNYYLDNGYRLDDMVVLFRNKSKARFVADILRKCDAAVSEDKRFNPCSSDAFSLEASEEVKKIIFLLRYHSDSKDTVARYWLENIAGLSGEELCGYRQEKTNSLLDLVMKLINRYGIDAEDPFVCAFCDKLSRYCISNSNSVKDFLRYWDDEMKDESVLVGKRSGSLELQTIHKAKGLEYKVVIIPFCDWDFVDNRHEVWFNNPQESSTVKVFCSTLKPLHEAGEGYEQLAAAEEYLQKVDNLNLLYVALTRPKNCLSIICSRVKTSETASLDFPSNVGKLIYSYLQGVDKQILKRTNPYNETSFQIGTVESPERKAEQRNDIENPFSLEAQSVVERGKMQKEEHGSAFGFSGAKFALSALANRYFSAEEREEQASGARWGTRIHSLLSVIKTEQDLIPALKILKDETEKRQAEEVIRQMFSFCGERHWFDGTFQVASEQPICTKGEKERRPDRIMLSEAETVVVDYKFMNDVSLVERYQEQIEEYGRRLSQMGYRNIKLYLWAVERPNEEEAAQSGSFGELKQRLLEVKPLNLISQ